MNCTTIKLSGSDFPIICPFANFSAGSAALSQRIMMASYGAHQAVYSGTVTSDGGNVFQGDQVAGRDINISGHSKPYEKVFVAR